MADGLGKVQDETAKSKKLADAASVLGAHGGRTAASAFHGTTVGRIQSAFANSARIARIASVPPVTVADGVPRG